jgi:hypothetical protein
MYKSSASVPDSLVQFSSEIHAVDRITPKKEEIELGTLTQEGKRCTIVLVLPLAPSAFRK